MREARVAALLPRLWCLNAPPATLPAEVVEALPTVGVYLDTCLRQLAFGLLPNTLPTAISGERTSGAEAYRVLLEVATGLRSAVAGETNVGGQFRRATEHAARTLTPEQWHELQPIVSALLADARTIRRTHLQGAAGWSYGSLVRQLLAPSNDARILFVGTGDLTRSMLPLFGSHRVGVWNRRPSAPLGGVNRWFATEAADEAAAWATHVVLTTPADASHDQLWLQRCGQGLQRPIVHLGWRRPHSFSVAQAHHYTLDDVFALANARDQHRRNQLASARTACGELTARRLDPPPHRERCRNMSDRLIAAGA